jgi:hypothetical protein
MLGLMGSLVIVNGGDLPNPFLVHQKGCLVPVARAVGCHADGSGSERAHHAAEPDRIRFWPGRIGCE